MSIVDQTQSAKAEFDKELIEHAARCWDAECTNAERITKERHLVLTILIAFLGFGLFKVEWLQAMVSKTAIVWPYGTGVAVVIAILLLAAAYYFVRALFSLAHKEHKNSASAHLSLPVKAYYPPGLLDSNEQKRLAFGRTYRAYQVLQKKNEEARARLSKAWTRFGIGISLLVGVVAIYIACKTGSIIIQG